MSLISADGKVKLTLSTKDNDVQIGTISSKNNNINASINTGNINIKANNENFVNGTINTITANNQQIDGSIEAYGNL